MLLNREDSPANRRSARRFSLVCDLQYRLLGASRRELGTGKTVNMSSGGLLLSTDRLLAPGQRVEVLVKWPVKMDGRIGVKLAVLGEVVRVENKLAIQAAVKIERYEFRADSP
jgi:hypothetical protein